MRFNFGFLAFLILHTISLTSLFAQYRPIVIIDSTVINNDPIMVMPRYIGGEEAMMKYVAEHLVYPEEAIKNNLSGNVSVRFTVSMTGKIKNVEVVRSVHPILDQEAIRVVSSMPDWVPGTEDGNPIDVGYTLPINFNYVQPPKPDMDRCQRNKNYE